MDSLPLTETGKLDRQSLPNQSHAKSEQGLFVAPLTTAIEQQLVEIWKELLAINTVGLYDTFLTWEGTRCQRPVWYRGFSSSFSSRYRGKRCFSLRRLPKWLW